MGLRDLVIARKKIPVDHNQSFEVRGISLTDVMLALGDYGPQMSIVFAKIAERRTAGEPLDNTTIRNAIREVASEFPDLFAAVIALAADDYSPEGIRVVKSLPMMAQVEAIEATFMLTFQSEGDVVKFIEALTRALVSATGALNQIRVGSLIGIGDSVAN